MELIDRQAAIDALKRKQDKGNGDISRFYNTIIQHDIEAIEQLPPAQPKPCEDAVSRTDLLKFKCDCYDSEGHLLYAVPTGYILRLKPVTPKQRTGHWIPVGVAEAVGGESAQWGSAVAYHKCSECDGQALRDDFEQEVLSKWCPHCGAKMEGVSNERD